MSLNRSDDTNLNDTNAEDKQDGNNAPGEAQQAAKPQLPKNRK